MKQLLKFFRRDEGTTSVEYAVMLALILMSVIAGISLFGGATGNMFGGIQADMNSNGISAP